MIKNDFDASVDLIRDNLKIVREKISIAAEKSGRRTEDIKLIAVTKTVSLEIIEAAIVAGIYDFGENYPEQAIEKIENIHTDKTLSWHMIGHIQSRKSKIVCDYFNLIHSIDSMKIAARINRDCKNRDRIMPVLLEVNLSGEESKFGWKAWDENKWGELSDAFKEIAQMDYVQIHGLMGMPPFFDDPELTRSYYQRMNRLQNFLTEEIPDASWKELSIGTSFDYEVAIEEGATMVRLGTTLFGPRL